MPYSPELIGKWFSNKNSITSVNNLVSKPTSLNTSKTTEWCYCKVDHEDDLIGCDNLQCPIQWLHLSCLQIKKAPKGKWYCLDCQFQFKWYSYTYLCMPYRKIKCLIKWNYRLAHVAQLQCSTNSTNTINSTGTSSIFKQSNGNDTLQDCIFFL